MNRSLPPLVAGASALIVAVAIAVVPMWRIETVVSESGLPALLPIAAPPLGWTARAAMMLLAALLVAVPVWIGLTLLAVRRPVALPSAEAPVEEAPPSVRRADAHPDAPPRPPVRAARDLGTPFLDPVASPEPEVELPRDLNTPMAIFDPDALPMVPAAPPPTVRPLFRPPTTEVEPVGEIEPEPEPAQARPVGSACYRSTLFTPQAAVTADDMIARPRSPSALPLPCLPLPLPLTILPPRSSRAVLRASDWLRSRRADAVFMRGSTAPEGATRILLRSSSYPRIL